MVVLGYTMLQVGSLAVRAARPSQSTAIKRPRTARAPSRRVLARVAVQGTDGGPGFEDYEWTGADEWEHVQDRRDEPPLPIPLLEGHRRVAIVRHGQSTWNAVGRIQGSSNLAVLTGKGEHQAEISRDMLQNDDFDKLYTSPLARSDRTAEVIWANRRPPFAERTVLPSLREVDLYEFQGLFKAEGKARYGESFRAWQKTPAEFEIHGHAPVRELWWRASRAWQDILDTPDSQSALLVVAHNAVNQALIATALGLPPTHFRRLLQSNAAVTVLDFEPRKHPDGTPAPPRVTVDRLNQSPDQPVRAQGSGRAAQTRLFIVRHAETDGSSDGVLLGSIDEACNYVGEDQAAATAAMLAEGDVRAVFCSPSARTRETATAIAERVGLFADGGSSVPAVEEVGGLSNINLGEWEGKKIMDVKGTGLPGDAEAREAFWARISSAYGTVLAEAGRRGGDAVLVTHAAVHAAILCTALGLSHEDLSRFRIGTGGVTVLEFPDGIDGDAVARCINYTAHLGPAAVPVTVDDLELVCGIDGCF
ncbi:unnamed protein product [Pedinophyceae sp. YPF-701]|nr:unnamed protein product [Pedinophyceae sp. YPF-701]